MPTTIDTDVVGRLDGFDGWAASGASRNLLPGPVRDEPLVPDLAAFVLVTGGPPPIPYVSGGTGTNTIMSSVQVRVRSAPDDFAGGQAHARLARDRLHEFIISGYVEVRVREAEPLYLAMDEKRRHHWSINLTLEHRR